MKLAENTARTAANAAKINKTYAAN